MIVDAPLSLLTLPLFCTAITLLSGLRLRLNKLRVALLRTVSALSDHPIAR
jgi:hypothetical protein